MIIALALGVLALDSVAASPSAFQSSRDAGCTEWHDCRQLALAAADRREYETFHDLAWRAVQTGPPKEPALMYLLARAQALSGRPDDALVMLSRLADMGIPSDAATNDDFRRTRQLPGWPALEARLDRLNHPDTPIVGLSPPTPSEPAPVARPSASESAALTNALHFSTGPLTVGGLAYDAVSGRFVLGDRHGRKLLVVPEGSNHALDLVRADSAGFHEISAVEIDAKRGDLWVASEADADGAGTLHKLQLVSGRPLRAFRVAAGAERVEIVDLAVTPAGAVLVLDAASGQVLELRASGTSVERVAGIEVREPASLTVGDDEQIAYVAHRDGISRIDLRARTAARITAPKGVSLARIARIRSHRHALIAVRVDDDGLNHIVRLELNARGTAVTKATPIEPAVPSGPQTFVTISGDDLVYLGADTDTAGSASQDTSSGIVQFVAYRVRLR